MNKLIDRNNKKIKQKGGKLLNKIEENDILYMLIPSSK